MQAIYTGDADAPAYGSQGTVGRHPDYFKPGLYQRCYCFVPSDIDQRSWVGEYYVSEADLDFTINQLYKEIPETSFKPPLDI